MADKPVTPYLSFTSGADQYAAEILSVTEIRGWMPVRAIPDVPECVVGLLSFREAVVPVVVLRLRFNVTPVVYESTMGIIVVPGQSVVNGVSDVLDVVVLLIVKNFLNPDDLIRLESVVEVGESGG
ncbi:MAG: chemotaxis protein CheW [Sedimenticola sp.]|nr:chemotaxis protein CheW [Sedimenticola sp.]